MMMTQFQEGGEYSSTKKKKQTRKTTERS